MEESGALTPEQLDEVYAWVDSYNLSRPKKNINRDFSDGLLAAEIVKHHFEKIVDLHNYPSSHNIKQKFSNWDLVNRKLFQKLGFQIKANDIDRIVNCQPEAVERVLLILKKHIEQTKNKPPVLPMAKVFDPVQGGAKNHHNNPHYNLVYTNMISPIETPQGLVINQPISGQMMGPSASGGVLMSNGRGNGIYSKIPPETPLSRLPPGADMSAGGQGSGAYASANNHATYHNGGAGSGANERRRSPVMMRAGAAGMEGNDFAHKRVGSGAPGARNGGNPAAKPAVGKSAVDYEKEYQNYSNKQLMGLLRDKDAKIQDLVDAVEILELKCKKLEQLVMLNDAERKLKGSPGGGSYPKK